jgi:AhpD family alkylhydroperoxidase
MLSQIKTSIVLTIESRNYGLKFIRKEFLFIMEQRINGFEKGQDAMKALLGLNGYLAKSPLEKSLLHLIEYRVSQINGCAYCLDMHSKDLRAGGETEQRIYVLDAWRETDFYTNRERAALAWAEAVTLVTVGHISDEIYEEASKQFSEVELIDLTFAITTINTWNRLNIAFRTKAGTYQPGQFAAFAAK